MAIRLLWSGVARPIVQRLYPRWWDERHCGDGGADGGTVLLNLFSAGVERRELAHSSCCERGSCDG